jgi:hypothetical protein
MVIVDIRALNFEYLVKILNWSRSRYTFYRLQIHLKFLLTLIPQPWYFKQLIQQEAFQFYQLTRKQICNSDLQILRRRHLFVVYLMTLSIPQITCPMTKWLAMNCNDTRRRGHGLNGSIVPEFAWTDWGKPQKLSFEPGPTKYLRKGECYPLNCCVS